MRTPILAALLGFALPACLVGSGDISGGGGGGGDDDMMGGAVCGNSMIEAGEQCDDGNAAAGDGCSATCQTEAPTPRLDATLDPPTLTTELGKSETLNVMLTSSGGFAGTATLAASFVDSTNAPVTGVTVTLAPSADVTADGMQMVPVTLDVATNATGAVLNGTLKIDVTSSAGSPSVTSAVTVNNIYTVDYIAGTGTAAGNHAKPAANITVKRGTLLHFKNDDTIKHIIHGDGTVFPHENQNDPNSGIPGRTYEVNTAGIAPGKTGQLGCHDHGGDLTYINFHVE